MDLVTEKMNRPDENFIPFMVEGWGRVCKVTDDRGHRFSELPDNTIRFLKSVRGRANVRDFEISEALEVIGHLLKKSTAHLLLQPSVVNEFGSTDNNKREFRFFRSFLSDNGVEVGFSLLNDQPGSRSKDLIIDDGEWEEIANAFLDWLAARRPVSAYSMHAIAMFSQQFLGWIKSNPKSVCDRVLISVVSNDHSPSSVAFAQAMRFRGVPVLYLQHAEVTDHFPPLSFDISVLHNERSIDVYRSVGPVTGKTFVIPRRVESADIVRISDELAGPVTVGLYLTEQVDLDSIRSVIERLESNPRINELSICPHPRSSKHALARLNRYGTVVATSELNPDVALVQNSSVVTELLHQGIKVFHLPGYDWLPSDYYGFVSEGICGQVELEQLDSEFWLNFKFDATWNTAYNKLDPTVRPEFCKAQSKALSAEICHLIESRKHSDWRREPCDHLKGIEQLEEPIQGFGFTAASWALAMLFDAPVSTFASRQLENLSAELQFQVIVAIEESHGRRDPRLVKLFYSALRYPAQNVLHAFLKLKAIEWTFTPLSDALFGEILTIHAVSHRSCKLDKKLENAFFTALLRRGEVDWLKEFMKSSRHTALQSLGVERRIILGDLVRSLPKTSPFRQGVELGIKIGLSGYDRLKFDVFSGGDIDGESIQHDELLERFSRVAPEPVRREFSEVIVPIYEQLKPQLKFMDVRRDQSQRNKFFKIVEDSLKDRKPFSFVRLSDGEGYLFQKTSRYFSEEDAANRELHWWGQRISDDARQRVIRSACQATEAANIVGIPSVYRFLKDISSRTLTLADGLTTRGLISVLEGIGELRILKAQLTEEKANIPLFMDFENIIRLVDVADRVVFVASVRKEIIAQQLGIAVDLVPVPTHFRTHDNSNYVSGDEILPNVFEDLSEKIAAVSAPGVLVLVSAGVAGKGFLETARQAGAVALDVGGAVDQWLKVDKLAY